MEFIEQTALIGGAYLLMTGAGFLLQPSFYLSMIERQDQAEPMLINLSGACHFIVGLIVVVNSIGL